MTTVAMAMARTLFENQRRVALVDLDPDGGVISFRTGVPATPGVFLVLDPVRDGTPTPAEVTDLLRQTPGGWALLPGFLSSGQAHEVAPVAGSGLLQVMAQSLDDVVVDSGRIRPGLSTWILASATHVVWVLDPRREGVVRFGAAVTGAQVDGGEVPGYVLVNRANAKGAVSDLAIGVEREWGLQVAATCDEVPGDPVTSLQMAAACAQVIGVMAPETPIHKVEPGRRRWRL